MGLPGFLGVLLVVRWPSLQSEIIFQHPFYSFYHQTDAATGEKAYPEYMGRLRWTKTTSDTQPKVFEKQLPLWDPRHKEARSLAKLLLLTDPLFHNGFELSIDAGPSLLEDCTARPQLVHQHLRFICYPCAAQRDPVSGSDVSEQSFQSKHTQLNCNANEHASPEAVSYETVEWFSIVFIFDSRVAVDVNGIYHCAATLAKAFQIAEKRFNHLSIEVKKITRIIAEFNKFDEYGPDQTNYKHDSKTHQVTEKEKSTFNQLQNELIGSSSLCRNMYLLYEDLKQTGEVKLLVNDWLVCHLNVFAKEIEFVTTESSDGLLHDRHVLQAKQPNTLISAEYDAPDTRQGRTSPVGNFGANLLSENIKGNLGQFAFCGSDGIGNTVKRHRESNLYLELLRASVPEKSEIYVVRHFVTQRTDFGKLQQQFSNNFGLPTSYLIEILGLFSQLLSLEEVKEKFYKLFILDPSIKYTSERYASDTTEFEDVLDWLVASGTISPLLRHILFLPIFISTKDATLDYDSPRMSTMLPLGSSEEMPLHHIIDEDAITASCELKQIKNLFNFSKFSQNEKCSFPTQFFLSASIVETFCGNLRKHLLDSDYVNDFTDQELLHIYLFIKEQLYISDHCNASKPLSGEAAAEHSVVIGSSTPNAAERKESFVCLWRDSNEMERDIQTDLCKLEDSLPPVFHGALHFLLDFITICIRNPESIDRKHKTEKKALFWRLYEFSEDTKVTEDSSALELFNRFFIYKHPGSLSECFRVSYS